MKINKILAVWGVFMVVFGGFVFGLARVSAEDENESLKKQNEQMYEAQKKTAENAYEAQKKSSENAYEAQKKEQERLREAEKDKRELEREMRKATSSDDEDEDDDRGATSTRKDDDEEDGDDWDNHRSSVAEFVRKLHEIASSTQGGIGEQVREVARAQNESKDRTAEKLKEIESRGAFIKFLIGVNSDSVKELQNSLSTIGNHIDKLNGIKASTAPEIQKSLDEEISVLNKEKERVQAVVNRNQNKSGIFGWLIRIF